MKIEILHRLCRAQCTSNDQLWCRVSSSNLDVCDYNTLQRRPAAYRYIRCNLLWSRLCCIQVQIALRYVLHSSFAVLTILIV